MLSVMLVLGFVAWKYSCGLELTSWNSERCKSCGSGLTQYLANARKLGNWKSSEGLSFFRPSHGTNLAIMLVLAGDIEVNPGPRFQCGVCKKYCKASDRIVECEDCKKRFHASCSKLGVKDLETFEAGNENLVLYKL